MIDGIGTFPGMMGQGPVKFAQAASIVALWDFESGARTTDSAGSNTLTQVGTPTTVTGKIGDGAGGFSASDYFKTAAHVGPSGTAAISLFGHFKTTSQENSLTCIISVGDINAAGNIIIVSIEDGQFWIRAADGRVASYGSFDDLNDGVWHSFVVATPANSNLSDIVIYVDGVSVARTSIANDGSIDIATSAPTHIGTPLPTLPFPGFPGDLDQIGIADTAWSAADAADFHNSGDGQPTSYLLGQGGLSVTYRDSGSGVSNASAYTISGLNIGASGDRQYVIAAIFTRALGSNLTLSNIEVGGVAATTIASLSANDDAGGGATSAYYIVAAEVPTGTTADITWDTSLPSLRGWAAAWTVRGVSSLTPVATDSDDHGNNLATVPATATVAPINDSIIFAFGGTGTDGNRDAFDAGFPTDVGDWLETAVWVIAGAKIDSGSVAATVSPEANNQCAVLMAAIR